MAPQPNQPRAKGLFSSLLLSEGTGRREVQGTRLQNNLLIQSQFQSYLLFLSSSFVIREDMSPFWTSSNLMATVSNMSTSIISKTTGFPYLWARVSRYELWESWTASRPYFGQRQRAREIRACARLGAPRLSRVLRASHKAWNFALSVIFRQN